MTTESLSAKLDSLEVAWLREVFHTGNYMQRKAALHAVIRHFESDPPKLSRMKPYV